MSTAPPWALFEPSSFPTATFHFEKPRGARETYPIIGGYQAVRTQVQVPSSTLAQLRLPRVIPDLGELIVMADALLFYDVKDVRGGRTKGEFAIQRGPVRWRYRVLSTVIGRTELYACLVVNAEPVPHQAPRLGECRTFDLEWGSYDGDVAPRSRAITELYGIEALVPGTLTHSLLRDLKPWSTDLPPFDGAPP